MTDDWRAYGLKKVMFAIEDLDDKGTQFMARKRWKTFVSRFQGLPAVEVDHANKIYFQSLLTAPTNAMEIDMS